MSDAGPLDTRVLEILEVPLEGRGSVAGHALLSLEGTIPSNSRSVGTRIDVNSQRLPVTP